MYKTNVLMKMYDSYSLSELENMWPWEREVYIALLLQEKEKQNEA